MPLPTWFRAMWWVTSQKTGASARDVQQVLGLGSYETAWTWLHKLRRAMVRPCQGRLTGRIELDATYVGGLEDGVHNKNKRTGEKALIAVAVEVLGGRPGRIRMRQIPDASSNSLLAFVDEAVERGSLLHVSGLLSSNRLEKRGYRHRVMGLKSRKEPASELLPRVHEVISQLKQWLLGTHQGAVTRAHLDYHLDEFTFRFNHRTTRHRGKLFHHLVQQAVSVDPAPYTSLVKHVRARPKRRRGRHRT
jgi:hypothetical protein